MFVRNRFFFLKTRFEDPLDGDGDGDDQPPGGGNSPGVDPEQFNQLVGTVGTLAQSMQTMQETLAQLSERAQQPADDGDQHQSVDGDLLGDDLETLSRADFAKFIIDNLNKQFTTRLEDIQKKLDETRSNVEAVDTKTTIKEFAATHKDFWDWQDELKAIVQETPGISIERAYKLVRAENPQKAAELDKKYSGDGGEQRKAFGGLTPTSGQTAKSTSKSPQEAAEAAWQQAMSGLEAALSAENV